MEDIVQSRQLFLGSWVLGEHSTPRRPRRHWFACANRSWYFNFLTGYKTIRIHFDKMGNKSNIPAVSPPPTPLSRSSAALVASARLMYFRKAAPVASNIFSTRGRLWGYALRNWCNSVIPSLCNAPVVSLEMCPMIVKSLASGSGSSIA